MANVPFKTIKFPGLSDTYTVPEIDSTLAVTGAAADAKKTGDEITNVKEALTTKAPLTGLSADLVAGSAEQLLSDVMTEDNAPYLFRANPTGSDREYDEIVGGTVAWNQLLAQDASKWGTRYTQIATSTGNVLTFTVSEQNNAVKGIYVSIVPNHKYLFVGTITPSEGYSVLYGAYTSLAENQYTYRAFVAANEGATAVANIFDAGAASTFALARPTATPNGDVATTKDIQLIDLTAMFGSTIADYVYSLETATAGSGIAWLKSYGYFTKPYYAYSEPTLKSVNGLSAHVMRGFNQWDADAAIEGQGLNVNGAIVTNDPSTVRSDYIEVYPNSTYCRYAPTWDTTARIVQYFNASKVSLGQSSASTDTIFLFTTPDDCHYIRVAYPIGQRNAACLNLSDPAKNGTYKPYSEPHTYALDSSLTFRGILKMDSDHNVYADGDVYKAGGTVTRRYGVVDLGSLTWTYNSTTEGKEYFYASAPTGNDKPVGATLNAICNKYNVMAGAYVSSNDKSIGVNANGVYIYVRDTSYTDAASFKAAMSGVKLVYEKATPTTESADPYTSPQIIDPDGTEEYVYASGGSGLPVGHNSKYPANLRDEVERVMVAVPSAPSSNGTYSLKCTVASGTPSYAWVADT